MPDDSRARPAATPQYDVVAIGASAGGVEALPVVVNSLPARLPAAVLIVQHMDPRHESMLARPLSRYSSLTVKQAADGEQVRPGTVYIAQPNAHLVVRDGRLALSDAPQVHFSRPSIDMLFEPVASAYGDRPQAARATGCADLVLPLIEIGDAIANLVAPDRTIT